MTKQETFDIVARHLLTQNERAVIITPTYYEKCVYRTPNGLRCAVGSLIPLEAYDPAFESCFGIDDIMSKLPVEHDDSETKLIKTLAGHDLALLAKMQTLHDHTPVSQWREALYKLALEHNISPEVPLSFFPSESPSASSVL